MAQITQSTTYNRTFLMVQSSDHITGATGVTPTFMISKAGATMATANATIAEIASGWYRAALTVTDTNTLGDLACHITATSSDPTDFSDQIVAISYATNIETQVWDATRSSHVVTGTFGQSLIIVTDGTAQTGAATSITLAAGSVATDSFYKGDIIYLYGGTGAGQPPNIISAYVGSTKVATVQNSWVTNPDATSTYIIFPAPFQTDPWDDARASHNTVGTFGEGVASVQGNVTGSVASVTGAVGSVTGNVGGNVSGSVASVVAAVTVGTNNDKTGYTLSTAGNAAAADKLLGRSIAGGADGGRTVQDVFRLNRNKWTRTATTLTAFQEDDTTSAWSITITASAVNPITTFAPNS